MRLATVVVIVAFCSPFQSALVNAFDDTDITMMSKSMICKGSASRGYKSCLMIATSRECRGVFAEYNENISVKANTQTNILICCDVVATHGDTRAKHVNRGKCKEHPDMGYYDYDYD